MRVSATPAPGMNKHSAVVFLSQDDYWPGQRAFLASPRAYFGATLRFPSEQRFFGIATMFRTGRHIRVRNYLGSVAFGLSSMFPATVFAAEAAPQAGNIWGAQIKISRGVVSIERDGQRYPGLVGARLKEKDVIQTGGNGSVGVMFNDNSTLSLGPDAEVILQRYAYDSTTYMGAFDAYIKRGTVSVQAGNIAKQAPDAMRMVTPKAELSGTAKNYVVSVGE